MEALSRSIADFILFIGQQAQTFWGNLVLLSFSWEQVIIDIILVAVIFYFIFSLFKGTRAVNVFIGLSIVAFLFFVSKVFQLVALSWLLDRFFTVILVAIPIIFQKELRMGLEQLGHTKLFRNQKARQIDRMIFNIVDACNTMAKANIGALIVVQGTIPLKEYVETGIELHAKVSSELLLSIFKPGSPLHDGAVIIANQRLQAASCILPHSFENTTGGLGTRHKAALGLSENTDASIVVVSEERGAISFAHKGKLQRNISAGDLQLFLNKALKPPKKNKRKPQATTLAKKVKP